MGFSHNYINGVGRKPTRGATTTGELVPNVADGTLWTKDLAGNVIRVGLSHSNSNADWVIPELRDDTISSLNDFEAIKWKFLSDNSIIVTGIVRGNINGLKTIFTFPEHVATRISHIQYGIISTPLLVHETLMRSYVTGGGSGVFAIQIQGNGFASWVIVNQMIFLDMQ